MPDSEALLRANIKALLEGQKKLPAELARHLGKSNAWVSQLLSGRNSVPVKTLSGIAAFFDVPVDFLFRSDLSGQSAAVLSPSKPQHDTTGHDGRTNPPPHTEGRERTLEAGLWDIIGTALDLVSAPGVDINELRAAARGMGGTSAEASRPSARHIPDDKKAAGTRR